MDALLAATRPPLTVVWLSGAHLHPTEAALLAALSDTVQAWLGRVLPADPPAP